ncbi:tetratricopeptide repeat protein [Pontibacter toksunensis]|uniref:Tetratricopeptide repeat protein n=1 Tax=Pontibacter toksunensis TaxID=1332631 RepID=A0ABW6BNA8_9BACT
MRNYMVMAVGLMLGSSACNTQNAITESNLSPTHPRITMADVVPVIEPQTAEDKAKQEKLLQKQASRFKSRDLASKYYVLQAKRAFNEEKLDSASYLFGLAYQMDSTNSDIYWGYGMVYGREQKYDEALFLLYRALEKDTENPHLLNDVATSHLSRFYLNADPEDLLQSKKLLEQAVKLSPNEADTYYKLAINCYYLREYGNAWSYLHKSVRRNKEIADKAFITALLEKEQDPQGLYKPQQVQ